MRQNISERYMIQHLQSEVNINPLLRNIEKCSDTLKNLAAFAAIFSKCV